MLGVALADAPVDSRQRELEQLATIVSDQARSGHISLDSVLADLKNASAKNVIRHNSGKQTDG